MKKKGFLLTVLLSVFVFLTGCEPLTVLDPKGPQAKIQSEVIIFSMIVMALVIAVVYVLYIYMLTKYRASKSAPDYEPPHQEGSKVLEIVWTLIPVLIVGVLSVVTVQSTNAVESVPEGYEDQKPLVIYASSSNWKWHFSYPEEGIETVNYLNVPTNRPLEFRMYAYGPITSLWIPQLGGQKYAMSDMVTKLHFVADHEGEMLGKNANFSGRGFAEMQFPVLAQSEAEFNEWVSDVKANEPPLTEEEFNILLESEHVGRKSYSSTHLEFSPPPEGEHAGHNHGSSTDEDTESTDMDHSDMDHSHSHSESSDNK